MEKGNARTKTQVLDILVPMKAYLKLKCEDGDKKLAEKNQKLQQQMEEMRRQLESQEQQHIAGLQKQIDEKNKEIKQLEAEVADLKAKLEISGVEAEALKKEHSKKIENYEFKIRLLRTQIGKLKLKDVCGAIDIIKKESDKSFERVRLYGTEAEKKETASSSQKTDLDIVSDLEKEIKALKNQILEYESKLTKSDEELRSRANELGALHVKVEIYEKRIEDLKTLLEEANVRNYKFQSQLIQMMGQLFATKK